MTDYSNFRRSQDTIDWLRAPQAEHFARQLGAEAEVAFNNFISLCEKSTDPKVTSACTRWRELNALKTWMQNAKKDAVEE